MSVPVHIKSGNNYSGFNYSNASNINELSSASSVSDNDVMLLHNGTNPLKVLASKVKEYAVGSLSALETTVKTSVVAAINEIKGRADTLDTAVAKCETLVLTKSSVSSLPTTISSASIETDMVCVKSVLSNPAAQLSDWTVNTDTAGQATISGTISGTTNVTLYMMKSR